MAFLLINILTVMASSYSLLCLFSLALLMFSSTARIHEDNIKEVSLEEGSGPWGNNANDGSISWQFTLDEGAKITRVIIRSYDIIDAIAFTVVDSNGYITTYEYGNPTSTATQIIFKEGEYITKISGRYGNYKWNDGRVTLSSIKIHTNKNTNGYGPYGKGADVSNTESFESSKGKAIGFYGTIGANKHYLESIGITLQDSVQVIKT